MLKIPFGQTGFTVSRLGFGAAPAAYLSADRERTAKFLNDLLDRGMNFIDTAASYPGSEEFLGEYLSHRRKDFILVSKCGSKVPGTTGDPWSARLIAETVDRSLKSLRTDTIDVMFLHSCDLATLKKGEAWRALLDARQQGKIRFAGYSGDNDAAAHAATMPDMSVVEMSINLCDQINIDKALPLAKKNDIAVIAKRPIANAAWKKTQPGMYQSYAQVYIDRLAKMNLDAKDFNLDWPELALRFTLSQPGVHTAIIGTTNPQNAMKNFEYAEKGALPEQLVHKIRKSFTEADPSHQWTGQT
jgi:aryl-alcohol dehydrogenase-like predicted oxidoreductase